MGQRDILLLISKLLADLKIPYLLTGSFASSYYGFPRATHDIDFVMEIEIENYPKMKNAFGKLEKDFLIDLIEMQESIKKHFQFSILHVESQIKVDFWPMKKNEFNTSRLKRKREEIIFNHKVWMISPEDLILTKLLLCKEIRSERHLRDCIGIIKVQAGILDRKFLAFWAKKLGVNDLYKEISAKNANY